MQLNLDINHINVILAALAKQPLEAVFDTFVAVKQQAEAQVKEQTNE